MNRTYETPYEGLKFCHIDSRQGSYWTYLDCHDGSLRAAVSVGPRYPSRDALMADLHRYASQWGHKTPYNVDVTDALTRLRIMDGSHTEGWAVIFIGPDELEGASITDVENAMLEAAWNCINSQKGETA